MDIRNMKYRLLKVLSKRMWKSLLTDGITILNNRNMERQRIQKVWVDDKCVYARTSNGLVANYPFSMWKRFEGSTPLQRQDFYLSYSGIHWPQLDEDLSFEGMFAQAGLCTRTETEDTIYWEAQQMETKPVAQQELDLAIEDVKKGNVVSFDNVEDAKKLS